MTLLNTYRIYYYRSSTNDIPIEKFLDSLSGKQQAKILRIFQYIKEYGLSSVLPHTKKLTGTPLWEIRILGKDNIRILYALVRGKTVVILHGFMKKSQKTPLHELHVALIRYHDWREKYC